MISLTHSARLSETARKSFVLPATERVILNIQQVSDIDLESMLRDILENETAIGLSNKELLGEQDACKTVSSTTVYRRPVKEKLGKPTNICSTCPSRRIISRSI